MEVFWTNLSILMMNNPITVFLLLCVIVWAIESTAAKLIEKRRQTAIQEQKTKQIQAWASMDTEAQQKLLALMPDWIDANDPDEVEAWKAARRETLQLTGGSGRRDSE